MENPFKLNDKVLTKVKGKAVEATVMQVFNNEVQVKTAEGGLLWRTMFTVWLPGTAPLAKPVKAAPVVEVTQTVANPPAVSGAGGTEDVAKDQVVVPPPNLTPQPETQPPVLTSAPTVRPVGKSADKKSQKGQHGRAGKGRSRSR